MISRSPIFRTKTVSGIGTKATVRPDFESASLVSSTDAFLMKLGSWGFRHMPS
jgi:hypothetical protein